MFFCPAGKFLNGGACRHDSENGPTEHFLSVKVAKGYYNNTQNTAALRALWPL